MTNEKGNEDQFFDMLHFALICTGNIDLTFNLNKIAETGEKMMIMFMIENVKQSWKMEFL